MTIIFLLAFLIFVTNTVTKTGKAKTVQFAAQPKKRAKPASAGLYQRTKTFLFGEKSVIVRLSRNTDGGETQHQVDVRVQWMNSTACIHVEDGLRYCQFLMVLENGKRVSLPITEKDAEFTVTYQGQRFNHWDCEVRVRPGLVDVLRGDGRKAVSVPFRCEPSLG